MVQRPIGVTIISILAVLSGAIGICWAISLSGLAAAGWLTGTLFGANGLQDWGNSTLIGAITGVVSAVLSLIFRYRGVAPEAMGLVVRHDCHGHQSRSVQFWR